MSQDVIATKVKRDRINPFYLAAYLNTSYGSSEMNRSFSGPSATSPLTRRRQKNLDRVRVLPNMEQSRIEQLIVSSEKALTEGDKARDDAQQLLESELGLSELEFPEPE